MPLSLEEVAETIACMVLFKFTGWCVCVVDTPLLSTGAVVRLIYAALDFAFYTLVVVQRMHSP